MINNKVLESKIFYCD